MRKRALLCAAALVALTVIPTACSASSPAHKGGHHHRHHHHHRLPRAPKKFYGVVTPRALMPKDANLIHRTGIGAGHFGLLWPFVQPGSANGKAWYYVDHIVGPLAAKGIRSMPFVWGSPHWVASSYSETPLHNAAGTQAWTNFLKAAVNRYGPGGVYWTNPRLYKSEYPGAKPMPINTWQIWNEPTLPKFFTHKNYATKYAKLVKLSHDVITGEDPHAKIILAGVPGNAKPSPKAFLRRFYHVKGIKRSFSGVALHPYAKSPKMLKREIIAMRKAMRRGHDSRTKLWLTEVGWGSGHPNRYGINKGLKGQKRMLTKAFKLVLQHRKKWRIQALYWFDWRDPPPGQQHDCSFCGSAGLLHYDFSPKPALKAYRHFAKR
jgi:hypothetical protein